MKLYFSSGFVYMQDYEREKKLYEWGVRYRLYSYFHVSTRASYNRTLEKIFENNLYSIMIDSGAYTVHKHGEKIDVTKYGDWLCSVKDKVEIAINLDVIPNKPEEIEKSAQEGWENLQYLQSRGLKILPVYHAGESDKWLSRYKDNYDYIGLSKTGNLLTQRQQLLWLDSVWKGLTDSAGTSIRKIHGFGVTKPELVARYPWFSVDSSTWGLSGVYGRVLIPSRDSYAKPIHGGIFVSKHSRSQRRKYVHYSTLSDKERNYIDDFVRSCGMSVKDLLEEDTSKLRDEINVKYFVELGEKSGQMHSVQPCFWV
jgi:hypothetical protein